MKQNLIDMKNKETIVRFML